MRKALRALTLGPGVLKPAEQTEKGCKRRPSELVRRACPGRYESLIRGLDMEMESLVKMTRAELGNHGGHLLGDPGLGSRVLWGPADADSGEDGRHWWGELFRPAAAA